MDNFAVIIEPKPDLAITPGRYYDWRVIAEAGGFVLWHREGMVRRVETDVLLNALDIYRDYQTMVDAQRLTALPARALSISWEQARAVDH